MAINTISSALTGVRGTHYNTGSDYVYYVQRGASGPGSIQRVRVTPYEIINSGTNVSFSIGATVGW